MKYQRKYQCKNIKEIFECISIKIFFNMEISSSWKLHSESNTKLNINELSFNQCLFSPDGKTFCQCGSSSITFITNDKTSSIAPPTHSKEEIRCISTAFTTPWILSIGTSEGRVIFYDHSTEKYTDISPDSQPVLFTKMCSYSESYFTKPYPVLFIQYPKGICATIDKDKLLQCIQNNTPENIQFTKWQLSNDKNIKDSLIVNSNIPFPIFPNLHKFPAVYSVGKPFISVSSISRVADESNTEKFKKAASRLLKWVFLQEDDAEEKPEIPINKALAQWELNDDKREGTSMAADPTGRWIAICDNMFRVIIVDSIFGHITKVLKGYRDAQIAWFSQPKSKGSENPPNSFLVVYVPTREIIVVCSIPNGNTVAAVKVTRDGKLFQTIDDDSKYGATFVYPTGDVAILNITASANDEDSNEGESPTNESFDDCHFKFPSIVTAEKDPSIQKLQKLLLQKKWEYEEVKKLANNITDKIVGGYFIKILINSSMPRSTEGTEAEDDFLLTVVNTISAKLNVEAFEGSSREFFDSCYSSTTTGGEDDLTVYKVLCEKWQQYSKFEKVTFSEDKYPKTNLTDKYKSQVSNIIDAVYPSDSKSGIVVPHEAVRVPPLRSFLLCPLKSTMFFFSFMRSSDVKVDSLFESFRISRENRNEFILQFLIWIVKCQPAQVLLTQDAIADFLGVKVVKSIAQKNYKKLDVSSNAFKAAALSGFLSF